jgi:hypothetical protein
MVGRSGISEREQQHTRAEKKISSLLLCARTGGSSAATEMGLRRELAYPVVAGMTYNSLDGRRRRILARSDAGQVERRPSHVLARLRRARSERTQPV